MAFQFADTFCTVTASSQSPYELVTGTVTYSSSYARFSAPSGCQAGGVLIANNSLLRKNINTISHPISFLSFGKSGSLATQQRVLSFWDSGSEQCGIGATTAGAIYVYGNGGTTLGTSATGILLANQTHPVCGIEVEMTIATSSAIANVWLNGAQVLALTGLHTQTTAHASCNQVQIGDGTSGQTSMYTDYLRVWDSSGSTQNAPVGLDRQPVTKLPSGVGTNTNWSPTGFASNYQCVSVVPPSGSDYVSASGTNIIDDYKMPVAGLSAAPSMVVAQSYYQKTDSNVRTYTNGVLSSGSPGVGSTFTANSGLTWVQNDIPTDPATGIAWTAGGADAANFLHEELS